MKALVTGGAGFIGSHLAEKLLSDGHEVIVVDNFARGREKNLESFQNNPKLRVERADIRNSGELEGLFSGVDWVFHLAALADIVPSIENPREYFEVNVDGTFNVLECARKASVKRVVYAASSSCYGVVEKYPTPETVEPCPEYPYALTKYLGEQIVMHYGKVYHLPVNSLRLFNVYGPRSRTQGSYGAVFGVFIAQKLHGKPFTIVGDGKQSRDFTFVTDVAEAFYLAAKSGHSGEIFNVGSGNHYSILSLVELLKGPVEFIPKRPGEPDCTFADTTKIKQMLGFEPKVTFEEGVAMILEKIDDFRDAPLWDKNSIEEATKTWFQYLGSEKK